MPTLRSLLVGVVTDRTPGAEDSVDIMHGLLPAHSEYPVLTGSNAKSTRILATLRQAAADAKAGDLFVFFFAGHGFPVKDLLQCETDGFNELLWAWDGPILDDLLAEIWNTFPAESRIMMISESCSAGTNFEVPPALASVEPGIDPSTAKRDEIVRELSRRMGAANLLRLCTPPLESTIRAGLVHFGASVDGGYTRIAYGGGLYAKCWAAAMSAGTPKTYEELAAELLKCQPGASFTAVGAAGRDLARRIVFSI